MSEKNLVQELSALFISQNSEAMARLVEENHHADIAEALASILEEEEFSFEEAQQLIGLVSIDSQAKILGYLPPAMQLGISAHFDQQDLANTLEAMAHDERVDFYNQLPEATQQELLPEMQPEERADLEKLAAYEEGTIGAVMTTDLALVEAELTAEKAIAQLRQTSKDKETIYQAYVVDQDQQLVGTVSLKDLIMAEPEEKIRDFMTTDPVFVRAEEEQEVAAQAISKYDLMAIPVLNGGDRLAGIVTYDDAMDVASEEVDKDFRAHGAVSGLAGSLKDATIQVLYKKRVFWLVLLVFGNIFSGAGIAYFEETIEAYVALVFFLPLLVDSGGNAGSQSATLMVRALATGEVIMKDWAKMLGRELAVAGLLGATMAVAVSLLGVWRGGMEIALVVALTMQLVVVIGSVIGMSLPFLLSRLKFDPATASAPLITSVADAVGVVIYFGMATWILDIPAGLAG